MGEIVLAPITFALCFQIKEPSDKIVKKYLSEKNGKSMKWTSN